MQDNMQNFTDETYVV